MLDGLFATYVTPSFSNHQLKIIAVPQNFLLTDITSRAETNVTEVFESLFKNLVELNVDF